MDQTAPRRNTPQQTPPDEGRTPAPGGDATLRPESDAAPAGSEDTAEGDSPSEAEMLRAVPLVPAGTSPHAHFGPRLAAALIDLLVLVSAATVLVVLFWIFGNGVIPLSTDARRQAPGAFALYWTLVVVAVLGYNWLPVAAGGRTPGKQAMGLVVVRRDGRVLSGRDAAIRLGALVLSTLPLGLGFLSILWDPDSRAWHDRIADTDVVYLDGEDNF